MGRFLKNIRNEYDSYSPKIFIGGLIGCKNDCYKPEEALQTDEAYTFHSWQIEKLVKEDVDNRMVALNKNYGIKILGGCCGTDVKHLRYIATKLSATAHTSTTG